MDMLPTVREMEVLEHIAQGKMNKEIAAELGISDFTVRDHVSSLLRKLGSKNRTELASKYAEEMQASSFHPTCIGYASVLNNRKLRCAVVQDASKLSVLREIEV